MTTAPAPDRLSDRKRAAILDAALAEFRATGYEATGMDRIAASAGVSKRTVYNHFPGKEALFTHILEAMLERGQGGVDLPYRADAPLRDQLLELVQQKLRLLHDPTFIDLARVAITAGLHSPDLARDMIERLGDREEGIARWIRAAATDGRLDTPDPPSPPPNWKPWSRASPSGRNSPWANRRWASPAEGRGRKRGGDVPGAVRLAHVTSAGAHRPEGRLASRPRLKSAR